MRNLTSSVSDWILAAACLAAACGGDNGQDTLPVSTAGTSATSSPAGTGSGSIAGTGSALAGTGSTPAAGSSGLAGRAATAGSTGSAGITGVAGTTAAGSAGAGRGGAGGTAGAPAGGTGAGAGAGHGGSGSAGQAGGTATGATFTAVYKIFMTNCSGASCHINATRAAGGLSMADKMTAYMSLVGVNSSVCSGEKRVVAGDAAKSELVHTLTRTQIGTCTRTPKMPGGNKPMLAQADIDTVTAWIAAGAPNN